MEPSLQESAFDMLEAAAATGRLTTPKATPRRCSAAGARRSRDREVHRRSQRGNQACLLPQSTPICQIINISDHAVVPNLRLRVT